jgi:hypothetical protein
MLFVSSTKIRSSASGPAFITTTSLSTTLDHRNPSLTCVLQSLPAANQCADGPRRKAKWRRTGTRLLQVLIAYKTTDLNGKQWREMYLFVILCNLLVEGMAEEICKRRKRVGGWWGGGAELATVKVHQPQRCHMPFQMSWVRLFISSRDAPTGAGREREGAGKRAPQHTDERELPRVSSRTWGGGGWPRR